MGARRPGGTAGRVRRVGAQVNPPIDRSLTAVGGGDRVPLDVSTTEPDQRTHPARGSPSKRRIRVPRGVAIGTVATLLIVVIALLGFDAVRSANRMLGGIKDARAQLDDGAESVVVGDPGASVPRFNSAAADAAGAVAASEHPSIRLLGLFPVLGPNIRATR